MVIDWVIFRSTVSWIYDSNNYHICNCFYVQCNGICGSSGEVAPRESAIFFDKFSVEKLPASYGQLVIPKAQKPSELQYSGQENTLIDRLLRSSGLLSVMKNEKDVIVIDAIPAKI